jgi:hypothetical protein
MFQLTPAELKNWTSQIVISNSDKMGLRKPPLVFTEGGVAMLSSVLYSEIAIAVNIIFAALKELVYKPQTERTFIGFKQQEE